MAATSAFAQTAGNQPGDIVVTAQFREQNLQDTPLSITAIDAATLEARGQTGIDSISNQAPNVTLKPGAAGFGPSLAASIRGIGQYDFNPALEPGVGLFVDDVYLPTLTGAQLELLDVDRIEVLRGPQGTLTGRNSIGGAIRIMTQRPGSEFGGSLEAQAGSRDLYSLRGSLNLPINDVLAARVSGVIKSQDGYVKRLDYGCVNPGSGIPSTRAPGNCQTGEAGDYDYKALRGVLAFTPNDRFSADLSADYVKDERTPAEVLSFANNPAPNASLNGVPFDSRFICGNFCNYGTYQSPGAGSWIDFTGLLSGVPGTVLPIPVVATSASPKQTFEGWGAAARMDYQLNDKLSLESISAYRAYKSRFADDDLSPLPVALGQNRLEHHFFSQEVRLNADITDAVSLTLGAYYSDQRTTYFTFQDIRYAPFPLQFIGDDPVDAKSKAAFATLIWKATDALTLTGGVRYTDESKDYTFSRRNPDGSINFFVDPTGTLNDSTISYSGDKTDFRISADYRWNENLLTYATVSTGFKGGGVSARPFIASQAVPFGQETLTSYEIGAKTDFFDRRLRLNASAFFNDYEDIQLTLFSCPALSPAPTFPCSLQANAGDAEVKGLELELTATPIDRLNIDASFSLLDFEYTRLDSATGLTKDDVAPFTPERKWSFGAQYEFELGGYGSLTPRVDFSYQDDLYTNAANAPTNKIDSYTLTNVMLAWSNPGKDLTVAIKGTNVSDKRYLLNRYDVSGGSGAVMDQPARPAEWAISVRKTF